MKKTVFLDRDGTLNVEKNYLYKASDWQWIDGAKEAIAALKKAEYSVVVISNQAGIARGFYTAADVEKLHAFVQQELAAIGTSIDAFYICPHHVDISGPCDCRKPAPGLFIKAAAELGLDLSRSWMIGDKLIDIEAGNAAGVTSLMVRTGYGAAQEKDTTAPAFDSIGQAASFILEAKL